MDFPNIAVGIIAQNDEAALKKTVQDAKTFSDAVFIIGTSAGTAAPFLGDAAVNVLFSRSEGETDQQNELIEYIESGCSADYLLWMTAGDRFDRQTFEELRLFTQSELERNSLYMLVVRRLYRQDGFRHDFDEENIEPRLIPLNKGLRYQSGTGTSIIEAAKSLLLKISAAPGRIIRFGGEKEQEYRRTQAEKLLQPFRLGNAESGDLAARAEAFFILGQYGEAFRDFMKLTETPNRSDLQLAGYYGLWDILTKQSAAHLPTLKTEDLTKILIGALDKFPVDMQLLTWMGVQLQSIGKLDLAVRSYQTALKFGRISLDVWHRLHIREIALTRLALLHRILGEPYEAIRLMEDGLNEVEDPAELSRYLLDLYIAEEKESKALDLAATIWGDTDLDKMRNVIYGACRGTAGSWGEALNYIERAYRSGVRDVLCLRWYSLALLSSRKFPDAVNILEEWLAVEPDSREAESFLTAAKQPEHFSETIGRIRDAQLKALGIPKDKQPHKTGRQRVPSIERAVQEMILASGGSGGGKIISTFGKKQSI
ncbi:MAG: hypothetical protein LBN39_06205 [Planctomycetaceae bacterium]|jgi:tetratricopeptide (TPR) repeat protein|nr:hypothetical protein [Planctomycetaceae bacterium]